MAWKNGPLPAGSWNWGAVVTKGGEAEGFYFADFMGDHVILPMLNNLRVELNEVLFYDNSITWPPTNVG